MAGTELETQPLADPARGASAIDPVELADAPETGRSASPTVARYVIPVLVGLAVAALLALLVYGMLRRQGGSFAGFAVNTVGKAAELNVRPAADFTLQLFDGRTFQLSEQRGRVVVVNYWASWCPPCREEARTLEAAWRTYRDRGVVLVGVDIWDTERDALAFLREFGVTYPNGPDPSGQIVIEYGVTGIPETYFVNREGQLVRRWIGPITQSQIGAFIEELTQ
ncbi:MAG TPA: TlpA disulfide reductase family protein [Chloroflexota bacterium]|nr:TlpA disulfide reductase family protein [Chloroflexota bacterium]